MLLPLLTAACLLLPSTLAVYTDEAFKVDYHFALVGQPKHDTTFFHQPSITSRASLLYTLSERGVLGAINPRDGTVVWRQLLAGNASSEAHGFLRAAEGQDVVVSGIDKEVAAWSAADGRLVWNVKTTGLVEDVEILELDDRLTTPGTKDVVYLTSGEGAKVERVDGATGKVKWQYKIEGSDTPYQVSASSTEVFVILLHKTILGYYKIRVVSLDPVDGHNTNEYTLSSENELANPDTIISVGANSASPIIAWTDASYSILKVNIIGTKAISTFNIDQSVDHISIHAPYHTNSLAHFLVHCQTAGISGLHWADVFHINLNKNKIEKAYSLPKVAGKGAFSTSVSDANVYFTRITQDELSTVSSASHGILGKWPVQGLNTAVGTTELVWSVHTSSELSIKGDNISAIRTAVLLSTGDWVLLRNGVATWMRPEALADIEAAAFASSSPIEDLAQSLEAEMHSNFISAYIHRVVRHMDDLKRLPSLLASLPQRLLGGFLGTSADGGMESDTFGYHQIIACATKNGRLIALDAANTDRVLWSRQVVDNVHWEPQLSAQADVLILGNGEAKGVMAFNATNGQVLPAVPIAADVVSGPNVRYTRHGNSLEAKRLDAANAGAIWHFTPMEGEQIHSIIPRPVNDPVASIGKVLGDRRVLYKFLDPNLALLVTTNPASNSASIYVLDTITGAILFSNSHSDVDLTAPISTLMSENWFAYSYTASPDINLPEPKGHHLVIGEMFESLIPNDRGASTSTSSNFSALAATPSPITLSLSYQVPEPLSHLAVTQTNQGITSRNLLAYLTDSHALLSIPYAALDPRRPVNRDPTKDEQMEGLVQYTPVLDFPPQWSISHVRDLIGITDLRTSPAKIESTTLVFAWGLDVFGTRLTPSFGFDVLGAGFNKFQMLATVVGLGVLTIFVAPLVERKGVGARWGVV